MRSGDSRSIFLSTKTSIAILIGPKIAAPIKKILIEESKAAIRVNLNIDNVVINFPDFTTNI